MALKPIGFLALAGALSFGAAAAIAQDDMMMPDVSTLSVDEIVELRVDTMRSNGRTMRGANELSGAEAVAVGNQIADNARLLKLLFPEGSNPEGSNALDNIWTDWDNFIAILDKLEADAMATAAAAESGDQEAYLASLQAVGGNCGTCHGTYRAAMN